ncbi:MAG: CNNM domain-containing protein, partial [Kiritimatiellia bacterium]
MMALEILLLLACLSCGAFFAGVETGVISINRLRLQHLVRRQVPGAKTIRHFLTHSDLLLGTTLIGTNLSYVVSAVLAASIGRRLYGAAGAAAAGLLLVVVVLVFCEYIPKAWFQAAPARRTLPFAGLLRAAAWLLRPFSFLVNLIIHWALPRRDAKGVEDKMLVTREELLHLAREGEQSGVLTKHESEMIHGVFDLTHKTCDVLM